MDTRRYCVLVGLLAGATVARAQTPEVRLAKPDARFPREFSSIAGLLELPDGRVLVSDGIDETLLRVDMRTMRADTVSRTGSGPGEYKSPDLLFGLPGGAVLLVDLGNARLSFFDAALKYQESSPIARGNPATGLTMVIPDGVDAQGRIYFRSIMRDPSGKVDSGAILRWDRVRNSFDTLAKLKLGEVKVSSTGGQNSRSVSMRPVPLSPEDVWAVAPNGKVALVRASDYHLEWVGQGGQVTRGPATAWRPVPIKDADKREYTADMRNNGLSTQVMSENGRMSVRMGRGNLGRGRDQEAIPDLEWPSSKPAARSVRVSPAGEAWVERHVAAGSPRQYDVFGMDGKLARRVILPEGRRLVGFGNGVVYLRETTSDDLIYLERYRL
jgi:hypothetical protein